MRRLLWRHAVVGFALAGVAGAVLPDQARAAPGDMTLATFLPRAEKLNAKGMMAVFSSDLKPLIAEVEAGFKAYRARLAVEKKAGHPSSCPPARASLSSDDILNQMRSYPPSARATTTVTTAAGDLFIKRYPCAK